MGGLTWSIVLPGLADCVRMNHPIGVNMHIRMAMRSVMNIGLIMSCLLDGTVTLGSRQRDIYGHVERKCHSRCHH